MGMKELGVKEIGVLHTILVSSCSNLLVLKTGNSQLLDQRWTFSKKISPISKSHADILWSLKAQTSTEQKLIHITGTFNGEKNHAVNDQNEQLLFIHYLPILTCVL